MGALDDNGDGRVDIHDFERYFGTQDDIRSLFQRQNKQGLIKGHVLDFDGFLKLMLPNGFQPCKYPDPDNVPTATSEQIFRWLHDDAPCAKDMDGQGMHGQGRNIRPASPADSSNETRSLKTGVSLPSLPCLPAVPPNQRRRWQRTPLEHRT